MINGKIEEFKYWQRRVKEILFLSEKYLSENDIGLIEGFNEANEMALAYETLIGAILEDNILIPEDIFGQILDLGLEMNIDDRFLGPFRAYGNRSEQP